MNLQSLLIHFRNLLIFSAFTFSVWRCIKSWDEIAFTIAFIWGFVGFFALIVVLIEYSDGDHDDYIEKHIDPKIDKLYNWLNRKNK